MVIEIAKDLASKSAARRLEGILKAERWLHDPRVWDLVKKALRDPNPMIGVYASRYVDTHATEPDAPELHEIFAWILQNISTRDIGCELTPNLAIALGKTAYKPAVPALTRGLNTVVYVGKQDVAGNLRGNCARALGRIQPESALLDLSYALLAPYNTLPLAMVGIAQALSALTNPAAIVPLALKLRQIHDIEPEGADACITAVVEMEHPRAVEIVAPYLRFRDDATAVHAALMIVRTRSPEAPTVILSAIENVSGGVLRGMVFALGSIRSQVGRAAILGLADNQRDEVRMVASEFYSTSAEPADRALLARMAASDPSSEVRKAAREFQAQANRD